MEVNISEKSGFVRLALGTGLTACGIAHLAKDSGSRTLGSIFLAAGALKVAEGIFLYCPTKALINSNVKEAVATTFDEYLDGDSLMQAYNQAYDSKWNGQGGSQSGSQSSSSSQGQSNSTIQNVANAASQVAQTVSNVAPSGTMAKTASQAVKTVADTVSGNQNSSQNKQNNQSKSTNSSASGQKHPS